MTKITAFFTALFTWLGLIFCPAEAITPVFGETEEKIKTEFNEGAFVMGQYDIIVSPDGDDGNEGTLASPVKTLKRAKELLKSNTSDEAVSVWFREGTYIITEEIIFDSSDRQNVTYRSYPDEKVEFTGSKEISGFTETEINGVRAFVTDVEINGDEDYFRSLFKGEKRLSRSIYPKEGMLNIAEPADNESVPASYSQDFFRHAAAFYVSKNDILDFANPTDVEVKIMHYWCDEHLPVHSIDPSTGRIEVQSATAMRIRVDDYFIYENVKEALCLPGEWYLDRAEEKLYYVPEEGDTPESTVLYAGVNEKFLSITDAENISFQGIDFINSDWDYVDGQFTGNPLPEGHHLYDNIVYGTVHPQAAFEVPAAIYVASSRNVNFTDCRFENISYTAIKFDKASTDCNVTSCKFNEIGANAVFIHGEFTVPASTQRINVRDCHIGFYGRIFNNAIGILLTHAYDCELMNNEIHDGWYTGISVGWNWGYSDNSTNKIKICNNLIYNIGNGWLSDMGGIYTLGIQPDTVISGNVIYNVGCDDGAYGYGGWGIYLDEGSSNILVENNLVYDCSSQTFHQHYGKDNIIKNNIFAFGGEGAFRISKNEDHNSLTLLNNIFVTDDAVMYFNTTEEDWFTDDGNIYWDYKHGGNVFSGESTKLLERITLVIMRTKGYYNNALFKDPLFKDVQNRDFTIAQNSPAIAHGFVPFSYDAGTVTQF